MSVTAVGFYNITSWLKGLFGRIEIFWFEDLSLLFFKQKTNAKHSKYDEDYYPHENYYNRFIFKTGLEVFNCYDINTIMAEIPIGLLYSGTLQTNPNTSAVLITTGNLPAGQYLFQFLIAPSTNSTYNLELLDAADAVIQTTIVRVLANSTGVFPMIGAFQLLTNYEMRIRPQTSLTGGATVAASIMSCCITS